MNALTHEFAASLAARRERVFRALTDETELACWFAEHVEVTPQAGGEFRFWGRHTYGAPARSQAAQRIVRIEAPKLLVFSWPLEGHDSEVTLELTEEGGSAGNGAMTLLRGRHHFPEAPSVPRAMDLVDDLWRMTIANLRAHLAGGAGMSLPDFTDPVPRIRQTILIDAPRDQVFGALLDPKLMRAAFSAPDPVVEPHVGGRYRYGWKYEVRGRQVEGGPTRILELVEDTKLVTDWPDWRGDPAVPPQRVTWLLESIGERTRVILIHEPFERTTDLSDYPYGWTGFLAGLKSQVEGTAAT
jgi:uncharacterized protein YndB with AHSA1/START domain